MSHARELRGAILSGLGLGASGGAVGFAFFFFMAEMNWLDVSRGSPAAVLSITCGCVAGISAWLMTLRVLARKATR